MIFRLTCVKLKIRLENFKGVFACVSMTSDLVYFASLEIDKSYSLTLPCGKICVTDGHMVSHDQGLYSNEQGRKRRETQGTRLYTIFKRCGNNTSS